MSFRYTIESVEKNSKSIHKGVSDTIDEINEKVAGYKTVTHVNILEQGQTLGLAGVAEAAEILGVTRQRVTQLAKQDAFPTELGRIAAGPVWDRHDLETYSKTRRR